MIDNDTLPEPLLHEILRKLTPAIGRVLAKRIETSELKDQFDWSGDWDNSGDIQDATFKYARAVGHNSALREVLDPAIVEAVVRMKIRGGVTSIIDGYHVHASHNWAEIFIATTKPEYAERIIMIDDLPALVEKAWA